MKHRRRRLARLRRKHSHMFCNNVKYVENIIPFGPLASVRVEYMSEKSLKGKGRGKKVSKEFFSFDLDDAFIQMQSKADPGYLPVNLEFVGVKYSIAQSNGPTL